MHILELQNRFEFSPVDIVEPGTYYAEDVFAAQMLMVAGGGTMRPLTAKRRPMFEMPGELQVATCPQSDAAHVEMPLSPCHSILIGRTGGLGDLVLLTPVLREIKRRWPSVKIAVACIKELGQAIQNIPFIDEILSYPVSVEKANTYDGWIWLEGVMEKGEDSKTLHSVDCVAKAIGLDLPADTDKRQAYVVTERERAWADWAWPRIPGTPRIAIQVGASARCRTYPMNKTSELIGELLKRQWEVFLLGAPGEIKPADRPGLRIISDGYNFRQRAALVESADVFLGPDSSLLHVAGGLNVPAIGLYGPFNWQQRTAYCPETVTLTRHEGFACAGCNHHATQQKAFPDHCPTKAKGFCGVLEAIPVAKILSTIEELGKKVLEAQNVEPFEAQ